MTAPGEDLYVVGEFRNEAAGGLEMEEFRLKAKAGEVTKLIFRKILQTLSIFGNSPINDGEMPLRQQNSTFGSQMRRSAALWCSFFQSMQYLSAHF